MCPWLLLANSQAQDLSIFSPASPPAESIRNLALLIIAITAFIFIVVEGVLYFTTYNTTFAIDASSCALKWKYSRPGPPSGVRGFPSSFFTLDETLSRTSWKCGR